MYYGAIEAGGTKFVCAVSNEELKVIDKINIPTTSSEETMKEVFSFFDQYSLFSMGIGSFGPIDVNKYSPTYGHITTTPKKGWSNFDFVGAIKNRYHIDVVWTTDVNAAVYGETKCGIAKGCSNSIYLTVGTGIGGGAMVNGQLLEGFSHPEMGHLLVRHHENDEFRGICPYHSNCLEGLASGPAIEKRYEVKGSELRDELHVWELEAFYLAQALVSYTLVLRPEKIILGGGVMKQDHLFPLIRNEFARMISGYVDVPDLTSYIVPPLLEDQAAIKGCLLLAKEAKK